jgi:hypothetical protein
MFEHIFHFADTHCGIFNSSASVSNRPRRFSARTKQHRLTQVASLASRHELSTVHAAFFLPFTPHSSPTCPLIAAQDLDFPLHAIYDLPHEANSWLPDPWTCDHGGVRPVDQPLR